jgi:hypothetical protein
MLFSFLTDSKPYIQPCSLQVSSVNRKEAFHNENLITTNPNHSGFQPLFIASFFGSELGSYAAIIG